MKTGLRVLASLALALCGLLQTTTNIVHATGGGPSDQYTTAVELDAPAWYWPMQETTGSTAGEAGCLNGVVGGRPNTGIPCSPTNNGYTGAYPLTIGANITLSGPSLNYTGRTSMQFPGTGTTSASYLFRGASNPQGVSGQDISIEAWVSTTSSGTNTYFDNYNCSAAYARLQIDSGHPKLIWRDHGGSSTGTHTSSKTVNDGNGHYVIWVHSSSSNQWTLYVDGLSSPETFSATFGGNLVENASLFVIGAQYMQGACSTTASNNFNGYVSDVAWYGNALTTTQISNHYSAAIPPTPTPTPTNTPTSTPTPTPTPTNTPTSTPTNTPTPTITPTATPTPTITPTPIPATITASCNNPFPTDSIAQSIISNQPSFYWPLAECSGNTTMHDYGCVGFAISATPQFQCTVYNNDGNGFGGGIYSYNMTKGGSVQSGVPIAPLNSSGRTVASFPGVGTTSSVIVGRAPGNDGAISFGYDMTITAWVATTSNGTQVVFTNYGCVVGFVSLRISGGFPQIAYRDTNGVPANGATATSAKAINDGQPHYIAAVHSHTFDTWTIYVDNDNNPESFSAPTNATFASNGDMMTIGGMVLCDSTIDFPFNGRIGDVAIYNTALTSSQISGQPGASGIGTFVISGSACVVANNPTTQAQPDCTNAQAPHPLVGSLIIASSSNNSNIGTGITNSSGDYTFNANVQFGTTITVQIAQYGPNASAGSGWYPLGGSYLVQIPPVGPLQNLSLDFQYVVPQAPNSTWWHISGGSFGSTGYQVPCLNRIGLPCNPGGTGGGGAFGTVAVALMVPMFGPIGVTGGVVDKPFLPGGDYTNTFTIDLTNPNGSSSTVLVSDDQNPPIFGNANTTTVTIPAQTTTTVAVIGTGGFTTTVGEVVVTNTYPLQETTQPVEIGGTLPAPITTTGEIIGGSTPIAVGVCSGPNGQTTIANSPIGALSAMLQCLFIPSISIDTILDGAIAELQTRVGFSDAFAIIGYICNRTDSAQPCDISGGMFGLGTAGTQWEPCFRFDIPATFTVGGGVSTWYRYTQPEGPDPPICIVIDSTNPIVIILRPLISVAIVLFGLLALTGMVISFVKGGSPSSDQPSETAGVESEVI